MAKLEQKTKVVKVEVEKEVPDGFTLHLSDEEAQTLILILGRVGGGSPLRTHSQSIFDALKQGKVPWHPEVPVFNTLANPGSLYFLSTAELPK